MTLRRKYLELAEKLPYQYVKDSPTVKYYTDWRKFDKALILPAATEAYIPSMILAEEANIVLGSNDYVLRSPPENVVIERLREDYEPRIRIESKIQAVHFARLSIGVKIAIPANTSISKPLVIVSGSGNGFLAHHIVLDTGSNSRAKIILVDYAEAKDTEGVKTLVLEGRLDEGSEVELSTILLHRNTPSYHYKRIELKGDAKTKTRILGLAGEMSHFREDYELSGERSSIEIYGSLVSGNGRIDAITNAVHRAPRSKSLVLVRGVVLGEGLLVHRGVARVTPSAQWSSTSIDSLVSILSERGRGYSVPMLEIQTGRVLEARHSTAVTSIEEDQLFYLQSRGLSKNDAKNLLLESIVGYSDLLRVLYTNVEEILTILY